MHRVEELHIEILDSWWEVRGEVVGGFLLDRVEGEIKVEVVFWRRVGGWRVVGAM